MARRARGAGAVFQRADGRWEAQLRIGPSRRRSLYAQTRGDVVAKLDQARWSMALGLPVRMPVTRTVADYLNDWLEVTKGRVRCSTFENYDFNVRRINSQRFACARVMATPAHEGSRMSPSRPKPTEGITRRSVLSQLGGSCRRRGWLETAKGSWGCATP